MDNRKLKRYELTVYIVLLLIAALLAVSSNAIPQDTIKSITINLASEFLAVGVLFFIIKRFFLLGDDDEIRDDLKKLENLGLSLGQAEIENKNELKKISKEIEQVASILNVNDQAKVLEHLRNIRSDLQDVSKNTSDLVGQVTREVDVRQKELLNAIEKRFSDEISKSHGILTTAIERELNSFANQPNSKDMVVDRLVTLVEQAMGKMGDFQRTSIREESKVAFSKIEKGIRDPINNITTEVQEIKKRIDQLTLPPARK